jgi:hypothetical protein
MPRQTRSTSTKDIDKDIPSKKRSRKSESESSSEEEKSTKKKRKCQKKFNWKLHVDSLKQIIDARNCFSVPTPEECVEIATEMKQAPGITGEIVRSKLRGEMMKNYMKKLQRNARRATKQDNDEYDSNSDYESSSSESESDVEGVHDLNGFSSVPTFWIVQNSEHRAYFTSRKLLMRAKHTVGTSSFDVLFTVNPPTVQELMQLVDTHHPPSLSWLDCANLRIQNQIKEWKPITWKVRLEAPPPLMPGLYNAEAKNQFSWIEMPFHAPTRYTDFGDEQVDIENDTTTGKNFKTSLSSTAHHAQSQAKALQKEAAPEKRGISGGG